MLDSNQILENWNELLRRVNDYFPERAEKILRIYEENEDRISMMPASSFEHFHNAFAGGYVDHILRVMDVADTLYTTWKDLGADVSGYTKEELRFAAMHHDLGKIGFPGEGNEVYQQETSDWHRKNLGRKYKSNPNNPFTIVPDQSLYLLQYYDVKVTFNEYLAIKIHDGMYDDGNKAYYISKSKDAKMKNHMPLLLHHADHLASQLEYERWKNQNVQQVNITPKANKVKNNQLKNLSESNKDIQKNLADIFKSFNTD